MKPHLLILSLLIVGCSIKKETESQVDSLARDSSIVTQVPVQSSSAATANHNFMDYLANTLTEDEREAKTWNALSPLLEQYDTTKFHIISKYYRKPGTEGTPDGEQNTTEDVTVTLYYNDAHELKAVKSEYNFQMGSGFDKAYTLYLFDKNMVGLYEDKETALDMAVKFYTRGVVSLCPDCGTLLSAGLSSSEVRVSDEPLSAESFSKREKEALAEEASLLEYANSDSFTPNGDEFSFQTEAALDAESNYVVYYTTSKSYYEKFIKPKSGN